jgi:hypothetical protein
VLDTRNHLDADALGRAGLVLHGLGREGTRTDVSAVRLQ